MLVVLKGILNIPSGRLGAAAVAVAAVWKMHNILVSSKIEMALMLPGALLSRSNMAPEKTSATCWPRTALADLYYHLPKSPAAPV